MKKRISLILIIAIVMMSICCLTACYDYDTSSIYLEDVIINTTVNEDGSITVQETWAVDVVDTNTYRNVYKSIGLYYDNFSSTSELIVNNVLYLNENLYLDYDDSVGNIDRDGIPNNTEYVYYTYQSSSSTDVELGVIMPYLDVGTHTFVFSYTITDAVGEYSDVAELYYKMFSEEFTLAIASFTATITLPELSYNDDAYMAYLHCTTSDSYLTIEDNVITATATEIESGTQIEIRALLDSDVISGELYIDSAEKQNIIDEEQGWADDYASEIRSYYFKVAIDCVLAALIIAGAIFVVIYGKIKSARIKGNYPEYYREVPEGWTVAQAAHVFYYYKGGAETDDIQSKLMSATILELARREYIKLEQQSGKDDCVINVLTGFSAVKLAELSLEEKELYDLLLKVQGAYPNGFTMDEFEKFGKKNVEMVASAMKEYMTKSKRKYGTAKLVDNKNRKYAKIIDTYSTVSFGVIGLFIIGVLFGIAGGIGGGLITVGGAIIGGIIAKIGRIKRTRLTEEGERLLAKFVGLEKYMKEFSNLKDYDVPKLILWEEYLVYATMMGISKEVIDDLKLVYVDFAEPTGDMRYVGYHRNTFLFTYMMLSMGRFGARRFDLGRGFARGFGNMHNHARGHMGGGMGGHGGGGRGP
ncbi:MAG: DUF2207 domain-containing protein, partial [Bacillota bacterium]